MLLAGCGAGEAAQTMPPLTPEPELPLFASDPAASPQTEPAADGGKARKALQRVLRGAGAGRTKVCAQVAPAFARARLGGTCAAWIASLTPEDGARLRAVKVGPPAPGTRADTWIFQAADLGWPLGAPASPAADRYVMRLKGARWTLTG
ncbi:hypothetical protein EDD29_7663 [Actinocorallia herbida]|uniref:Uncharacterized protein n=1 Tax=Actinocorallia herbida TaxID=58109 RepID=A0A3N1D8X8_9ACTN|nr:hypothetical protein EDD29_7663 [Actinocorallia herbida]